MRKRRASQESGKATHADIETVRRFLSLAKGFALAVVQAPRALHAGVIQALGQPIRGVEAPILLQPPGPAANREVLAWFRRKIGGRDGPLPPAVVVHDFRRVLDVGKAEEAPAFFRALNHVRNDFTREIAIPVVFVMTEEEVRVFQWAAPDFFSIHSLFAVLSGAAGDAAATGGAGVAPDRILLLHLSDVQFGDHSPFPAAADPQEFAEHFAANLAQQCETLGGRPDLCIVSGDIAQRAFPKEYEQALEFFTALADCLELDRYRFVFAPGNHDVNWRECRYIADLQEEEGFDDAERDRRMLEAKLRNYHERFLAPFHDVEAARIADWGDPPLPRFGRLRVFHDLDLEVAVLNSCESETHEVHRGRISREQAQALLDAWGARERAARLKIAVVHHNPNPAPEETAKQWRKYWERLENVPRELVERMLNDIEGFDDTSFLKNTVADTRAQLLLHGHLHTQHFDVWPWRRGGQTHVIGAGALRVDPAALPPGGVRHGFHIIELRPDAAVADSGLVVHPFVFELRARVRGKVRSGAFVADPAFDGPYEQRLSLPDGYRPRKVKTAADTGAAVPEATFGRFVDEWRRLLEKRFDKLDFRGAYQPASALGEPVPAPALDEIVLDLRFAEGYDPEKVDRGAPIGPRELTARKKPLLIRGPAGGGKTTWVKITARRLAADPQWNALPIPLFLRNVAGGWQKQLETAQSPEGAVLDLAARALAAPLEGRREETARQWIESGAGPRPVLLVDGWDELGDLGQEFRARLLVFMEKYPHVVVAVTSRPFGQSMPEHADGFDVLDVQPLNPKEIRLLASRFHRFCFGLDETAAEEETVRFMDALADSPETSALARNPLHLTMLLLIARTRPLPDKRHLLYKACIENLLEALPERYAREGVREQEYHWRPDDSQERFRITARLAAEIQRSAYERLDNSEDRIIVAPREEWLKKLPVEWTDTRRAGFLAWLAERAGLLTENTDGSLQFAHLSFQEYLTARRLDAECDGLEARLEVWKRYSREPVWWETLRLWAAILDADNPERVDELVRDLPDRAVKWGESAWESKHPGTKQCATKGDVRARLDRFDARGRAEADALGLLGCVLADGLGTDKVFNRWTDRVSKSIEPRWSEAWERTAQAWRASRATKRRDRLAQRLRAAMVSWKWLPVLRGIEFLKACGAPSGPLPAFRLRSTRVLVRESTHAAPEQEKEQASGPERIAFGRVLCGAFPLWPPGESVALLHAWPGVRRLEGLRLQAGVSVGISPRSVSSILERDLAPVDEEQVRALAGALVRELAGDLARDWCRDLAHAWAQYWRRYWVDDLTRRWAHHWVRSLARDWARSLARDLVRNWAYDFARDFGRDLARDWAAGLLQQTHATNRYDADQPAHFATWGTLELLSVGRASAAALLAFASRTKLRPFPDDPAASAMARACRIGAESTLDAGTRRQRVNRISRDLDDFWRAFARHLARCSDDKDRALLEDAVRHPEHYDPPLRWGLRFIVRGDVMLEDGSVATLDELAREAGVEPPPYLEDVPEPDPELDRISEKALCFFE